MQNNTFSLPVISTSKSAHNQVELTNYIGGSLVSIRKVNQYQQLSKTSAKRPWKRGVIAGWSRQSRTRMQRQLCKVNRSKLKYPELFITMTYGKNLPDDYQVVKKHLNKFTLWIRYHYPESCGTWKLEPQPRRSIREGRYCYHYHLIIYNVEYLAHEQLSAYWNKLTAGDDKHLQSSVNIQRAKTPEDANRYLMKYLSKGDCSGLFENEQNGRLWGIFGRDQYNQLIDENSVVIGEYENDDTGQITTPDELYTQLKKIILKYKDAYSRRKWKKPYRKDYHYHIRKQLDFDTGEVVCKHHQLKPDKMHILWNDATLDRVINFITGHKVTNLKSVLQNWNRQGL